jgi:hypothetical protein
VFCGFKPKRFREWLAVVAEEGRQARWSAIALDMARVLLAGIFSSPSTLSWFAKMRKCYRCPVFDRTMKRCRPWTGSPVGCGCYMPFKALVSRHGWAVEALPKESSGFCW